MHRHVTPALVLVAMSLGALPAFAQSPEPAGPVRHSLGGRVCLNGVWRFQPAAGDAASAPLDDWGEIRVPGSWKDNGCLPGILRRGSGPTWEGLDGAKLSRGWYELRTTIPAEWAGRAVLLDLRRVSTDAVVTVNGQECGSVGWPGGLIDITRAVQAGQETLVRVLVVSVAEAEKVRVYMGVGEGQTWDEPAQLAACGIIGDVFLVSRPQGAYVSDVFARTSVREKTLSLDISLHGVQQAGPVEVTAHLLTEAGAEERVFRAAAEVTAATDQVATVSWEWPKPRLWDIGQPNLYDLVLKVRGSGVEDEFRQRLGFREFRIDGLRFLLNEKEIRLRPVCLADNWNQYAWVREAIEGMIDGYQWAGFNLGEQWPNVESRGDPEFRDLWAEIADRKGFLLAGAAYAMNPFINDSSWRLVWNEPGRKERWRERMASDLLPMRNHPSVVMWATSPNFFGRYQDQSPEVIGRRGWYPHDGRTAAGLEGVAAIKAVDPTRPVFTHHGADVGDLHTCNCYLCLTPLQEREEWLSQYVREGQIPFLPIEFGTPLHTTFMRGRNGFGETIQSEPLMTEFCATYLGPEAYRLESEAYRARIVSSFQGGQRYSNWQGASELDQAPAFQRLQGLFDRNTWRSWRTWGITAGMVPWSNSHGWSIGDGGKYYAQQPLPDEPGRTGVYFPTLQGSMAGYLRPEGGWAIHPAAEALRECNNTTLAWIAGSREAFTEKDHSYSSGQQVEKQIVLVNDERTEQPFRVECVAEVDGREVARDRVNGTLGVAETRRIPFAFGAPEVGGKTDGSIRLEATIGNRRHDDTFAFRVFPVLVTAMGNPTTYVFDPEGATTKLLRSVGYVLTDWDGKPAPGDLLIVGRHALDRVDDIPGSVSEHVRAGGRCVIFGQAPDALREAMGFRVAHQVSRRLFPVPGFATGQVLDGLDAEDLRDWRGAGTLVADRWGGPDESPNADPPFGWHWGNRGSVSSAAIEKPHNSGWTPLLEGEFDLAYSSLLSLRLGGGSVVLCTLDLEGRTAEDPLVPMLARRIVEYSRRVPLTPRPGPVAYLGGDRGESVLRRLGVSYERLDTLPEPERLVVLGPDASVPDEALRRFVEVGGRVLLLARPAGQLPLGLQAEVGSFDRATTVPTWEECAGLSESDLRLRARTDAALLGGGGEWEVGAEGLLGRLRAGKGVAIAYQLTPDALGAKQKTYLRFSAWRVRRTLAQLLTNLGAEFARDGRCLDFRANLGSVPIPLAGEWLYRIEAKLPAATDPNVRTQDPGNQGEAARWHRPDTDPAEWRTCRLPSLWESWGSDEEWTFDGAVWLRREVRIPAEWVGKELVLQLGPVDDRDVTYWNGEPIGESSGWNLPRTYRVPAGKVHEGVSVLTVRCFDEFGGGGLSGRPDEMRIGPVAPPTVPAGEELLANTDFAQGTDGWELSVLGDEAKATWSLTDECPGELLGQQSLRVDVTAITDTSWHVSVHQLGLSIQAGVPYRVSFWAKADSPCSIVGAIEKTHPPYGGAGLFQSVLLDTKWQRYVLDFTPEVSDTQVHFSFQQLGSQVATYWFAAPSFTIVRPEGGGEAETLVGYYDPDYLEGHDLGDDPYRYYRW